MAVYLCSMCIVEPTEFAAQKLQLGRAQALGFPVNACKRAGPSFVLKNLQAVFNKGAIKGRVVRHDQVGAGHHVFDFDFIELLALDVLAANPCEFGNFSWNGAARVFEIFVDSWLIEETNVIMDLQLVSEAGKYIDKDTLMLKRLTNKEMVVFYDDELETEKVFEAQ